MASKKKIIELIAAIKTIYPYYATGTERNSLVNTWELILKDYPDKAVDVAMLECLKTCKTPPTPADVIEQLNNFEQANQISDEELWNRLTDAVHETDRLMYRFNFTFVEDNGLTQGQNARNKALEVWNQLPEELKSYLGGRSELLRMAKNYTEDDLHFEKNRFLKTMPAIRKRQEYKSIMLLTDINNPMLKETT